MVTIRKEDLKSMIMFASILTQVIIEGFDETGEIPTIESLLLRKDEIDKMIKDELAKV